LLFFFPDFVSSTVGALVAVVGALVLFSVALELLLPLLPLLLLVDFTPVGIIVAGALVVGEFVGRFDVGGFVGTVVGAAVLLAHDPSVLQTLSSMTPALASHAIIALQLLFPTFEVIE
jgi:hypothetical protein